MFFPLLTRRPKPAAARPTARPQLEALEDRTLLNSRFVVPAASADNATNFATLQAALTTPGLNPGDVIQIESGSAPGNVVNADLPAVAGLTVRGDPTAALSAIPQFTVSDLFTVGPAQEGFAFRHVNIGLILLPNGLVGGGPPGGPPGGGLVFTADGTIAGSAVVDVSSGSNAENALKALVEFDGAADLLTDATLVTQAGNQVGSLLSVNAPNGSDALVSDNYFDLSNLNQPAVIYNSPNNQVAVVTDQLIGNAFVSSGGTGFEAEAVEDTGALVGLTIRDNTFSLAPGVSAFSGATAVVLLGTGAVQSTQIVGNVVNLSAFRTAGVSVNPDLGAVNVFIAGNQINAGPSGTGLSIMLPVPNSTQRIDAVVQGNDFHDDGIGVAINGSSIAGFATGIDLGGGSLGSLGGNDFRGFTAPATAESGAIVLSSLAAQRAVAAEKNSFAAGVDPRSVVWDGGKASGLPDVDVSANLTGNAAFVAAAYADLFQRAGDTSSPNDAGGWIGALNGGALTQAAAASALVRSPEALGVLVDAMYLRLLGRPSDPTGRAAFVSFLERGGTVEQAVAAMASSPEYAALTGSDVGFVQALNTNLLGVAGSDAEVAGWVGQLPTLGRFGVADAFARSSEFRNNVVEQFYEAVTPARSVAALFPVLLHRPASEAEEAAWVNSGLDLLSVEVGFVGSTEFFVDG